MLGNLSLREKILISIAGLFIILFVFNFYLYQPLKEEIINLKGEIEQKLQTLSTVMVLAEQISSLKEEYESIQKERMEKEISKKWSKAELLYEMENLSLKNQVELLNFNSLESNELIKMNISLQGEFKNIATLLLNIKEWEGYFSYVNLSLHPKGDLILANFVINLLKAVNSEGDSF